MQFNRALKTLITSFKTTSAIRTISSHVKIVAKKPVKTFLEPDVIYSFCTCGHSKKNPFCDGSHKKLNENIEDPSQHLKPHKFTVFEAKEYPLCNCKHTNNVPYCDGSHKKLDE